MMQFVPQIAFGACERDKTYDNLHRQGEESAKELQSPSIGIEFSGHFLQSPIAEMLWTPRIMWLGRIELPKALNGLTFLLPTKITSSQTN